MIDDRRTYTIEHRKGSSTAWRLKNTILAEGEPAYETDTKKQKIGDGVTLYNDLPYFGLGADDAVSQQQLSDHISSDNPHPVYDDGRSFVVLYENAKV